MCLFIDDNMIMPEGGSVPAGTVLTVRKGEIFYRQPLGRPHAVSLSSDVEFSFLGQRVLIGKSDQLIPAQVFGSTAGQVKNGDSLYCTVAKRTGKKRIVGLSEVAAVGMDLDAIAKLRHVQTQTCVIDVGGNGIAEKAFIADTSNRQEIIPEAISPVALNKPGAMRMPGESEARMGFDGPVGILGNMSATLHVIEEGKPLMFHNGATLFSAGSLPYTIEAFGGRFTVLSYDKRTKSARIRVDRPFAAVEYRVRTELRRQ
jgi:hypothetical protein